MHSGKSIIFFHTLVPSHFLQKKLIIIFVLNTFRGADHQWDGNLFATVGAQVDIWDPNRYNLNDSFLEVSSLFLCVTSINAHFICIGRSQ